MDDTATMDAPPDTDEEVDTGKVFDLFALDVDKPRVYEDPIPLDESVFSPRSLTIDVEEMGVSEWMDLGNQIFLIEDRSPFWLGDWYNAGREKWGEEINSLFDGDNVVSAKTASNNGITCAKIPDESRNYDLNYSVHNAAAGLPAIANIEKALRLAAEGKDGVVRGHLIVEAHGEKWTEAQMRAYVKVFKGKDVDGEELKERGEVTSISFGIIWNIAPADEDGAKAAMEEIKDAAEEILANHDVMPRGVSGPSVDYNGA